MGVTKKYWKGIDELKETPQFLESRDQEFPTQVSVDEFIGDEQLAESSTGRRDFLKFLGFSVAAATVAACEAPVVKAVPYVNKPENVTPGMATWYASTYYDGNSYASVLVKTREGRPIFIKGNKDFGITSGSINPQIIASVLGLYDGSRLTDATYKGKTDKSVKDIDGMVKGALKSSSKVVMVASTIISPSMKEAINELSLSLGGTRGEDGSVSNPKFEVISYDAISYSGMRDANKKSFNSRFIPEYKFGNAKTIVSIGADFLSTWLMPTVFAADYGTRRNPDGEWMSQHFQFESNMSLTGSNADDRAMIKPSEQANVLAYLLKKNGVDTDGVSPKLTKGAQAVADKAYTALKKAGSKSLVVCGSNNTALQILTNKLNSVLGAYSETINATNPVNLFESNDAEMNSFVSSVINKKGPEAVIFYGTNPVYTLPNGEAFGKALANVKHKISLSTHADETASLCDVVFPDHHALESWRDHNPTAEHYAVGQPTIRPLHNTADAMESILVWAGKKKRGGKESKVSYEYIKEIWKTYGFPAQTEFADFDSYWNFAVHNSVYDSAPNALVAPSFKDSAMTGLSSKLPKGKGTEVVLYQKAGMGNGQFANNPWLQEMPDPMTKVTWDNYITMNPSEMEGYATTFDQENGLTLASLKVGKVEVKLPVYPMPGQALGTVGVALGYGRGGTPETIGTAAFQTKEYGGNTTDESGNAISVGENAYRLASVQNGMISYETSGTVSNLNESYLVAATQIHSTVMGRHSIVRETTKNIYDHQGKEAYNPAHLLSKIDENGNHVKAPVGEFDLWDKHPVENIGHRWGMSIDLSSCIGCSTCLIACQSENNVPVVGKDEIRRGRELHWIRIDRYFASEEEIVVGQRKDADTFSYGEAEIAAVNPQVVHMPMMCHHCNHAPCETVCPVAATTHSNEGLNQMTYNRCIGTRYCANNCPYKVRRFNWFNYPSYKKFAEINPAQDDLGRMVLNPDVTVRTRGVMEKCSFCVQRIQEGKLTAKTEGRALVDGDTTSACADACPTNAIVVGDWNDVTSNIRKSSEDKRSYQALEEVGVKPNVWYKVKVRNDENKDLAAIQKADEHHEEEGHDDHHKEEASHH
jgi:molybdopterin-containing oxidoreductase family iron-sulfur binding subunit